MTYGFSIKLKKGVPSRTKIRAELPLVLSYPAHISTDIVCSGLFPGKGSGHSRFLSVVIIAESVADTVNFFLCYRLDKPRTLLLIYFLFVPAVAVGSAGGKGVLPHGDLQRTKALHQVAGVSFQRVFFYPTAEPPKAQRIFFFEIPNEYCRHIQDTFYPPCNFPYNSTAVLKRLQHSHITKEAFRYGTTAK